MTHKTLFDFAKLLQTPASFDTPTAVKQQLAKMGIAPQLTDKTYWEAANKLYEEALKKQGSK